MGKIELWGGVECTTNRVHDTYRDQSVETGHAGRPEDIELIAGLNVSRVRYPILWERVSPDEPDQRDWRWTDERLTALREHGLGVIGGLIHHGSGPRYTGLLEDSFAPGLAQHAEAAAERYPWIDHWTPVNEPLTTARFTALYGHWHPHKRDEASFWLALVNQVDATRQAMAAIRRVVPHAKLVATDDLGVTYGTAEVREQAWFDNQRRWMSWDLMCGLVRPGHPFWSRLCRFGLEAKLRVLAADPCPPDIIGINHYLTSDRLLDHRVHEYPPHLHGGNGHKAYVDTEAIRVLDPPIGGWESALAEAWNRYQIPLAITEVHNGCTREEQMRWLLEAWDAAHSVQARGGDVRAVTVWSLFGAKDWNNLLTAPGVYEPGVFDCSSGQPRPTALAGLVRDLAAGRRGKHPSLQHQGWWRRNIRLEHGRVPVPAPVKAHQAAKLNHPAGRPLLIVGATGTLARALVRECELRGLDHHATTRQQLALDNPASIRSELDRLDPWAVVNAAGWVRVDDAEAQPHACFAANTEGAVTLAREAAIRGVPTVNFSSDLVFDGAKASAYVESDTPRALCVYGESKARMEREVGALPGQHLIVRTAAFFSPHDPYNFAWAVANLLKQGQVFEAAADYVVTPTYTPDLARVSLDLLIDGESGLWHLSSGVALSWYEFALRVADACGLDRSLVRAVSGPLPDWKARRPDQAALGSERGQVMPALERGLTRFAEALQKAEATS